MVMGAKRVNLLFVLTALLLTNFFFAVSPAYCAEDFANVLEQAIKSFEGKKYAESIQLLHKAQTLNPTSQAVAEWLDRVIETDSQWAVETGREKLIDMFLKGEDLGTKEGKNLSAVVKQLLETTTKSAHEFTMDADAIKAAVDSLYAAKDVQDWLKVMVTAQNKHGRYLVPALLTYLEKQEPQDRVFGQRALIRLGRDAVVPMIMALDHENPVVREQIARILGIIREPLAISSLKNLVDTDANDVVKKTAAQALTKFASVPADAGWRLLVADAMAFNKGFRRLPRPNYQPYIWMVKEGKLVGEKVMSFQVNRHIADTLLFRSTKAAPTEMTAWTQFAINRAAYVNLYRSTLALMKKSGAEESAIAMLEGQAVRMEKLSLSISKISLDILADALKQELAVVDKAQGLPAGCLELIAQIRDAGQTAARNPNAIDALLMSLESKYRLIKFDAALALAMLKPALATVDSGKKIVNNLASAIQFPGARVAMVVSPDDDVRVRFLGLLDEAGFMAIAADNALEGLKATTTFPAKHVILLDVNLKATSVTEYLQYLRNTKGGAEIPVVVLSGAPEKDQDIYHKPDNKQQVAAVDIALKDLQDNVLNPIVEGLADNRAKGEEKAQAAAKAIIDLLNSKINYDMTNAKTSLANAVGDTNRPDAVRIPAAEALGYLGDMATLNVLSKVAAEKEGNATEVRVASIRAMGDIFSRLDIGLNKDGNLNGILNGCLADEDGVIRTEAARAIGKAKWTPDRILNMKE